MGKLGKNGRRMGGEWPPAQGRRRPARRHFRKTEAAGRGPWGKGGAGGGRPDIDKGAQMGYATLPQAALVGRCAPILSRGGAMKTITIYTDGACSGNPGPGGWGAILQYGPHTREMSGGEADTTNNRMELTGVIRALQALKEPCIVELYSDSKYVIDALSKGWARSWRAKGWVKSDKKPALNPDLWELLLDLCQVHQVRTHWVKGHAENLYNNRCDQLAVSEWQKLKR